MPDYKRMYDFLFNQITDTIEHLEDAQQKTEELYIDCDDTSQIIPVSEKGNHSPSD